MNGNRKMADEDEIPVYEYIVLNICGFTSNPVSWV
jgi:hypothetical protein